MAFLSSPRKRRRVLWLGALLVAAGGFFVADALLPSHGGPVRVSPTATSQLRLADPAEEAAALRSSATVRPLANRFVDELVQHRELDRAYALLAPKTRERYSLLDWRAGRDLPLHGASATTGGASVVFSGRTTVGLVASFAPNVLFAVRFDRLPVLGWRITYMHQGQGSSYVSESSFSPAGFAPGSHRDTLTAWLILLAGFAAFVTVVALADRRLAR